MATDLTKRPYHEVKSLLESIGGTMTYRPGGGPGGVWVLALRGRTINVEVRDHTINRLDELYVPKVQNPRTWDDYSSRLVDDAFWILVTMFL